MSSTNDGTLSGAQPLPALTDIGAWLLEKTEVLEAWAMADADWVEMRVSSPAGVQKQKLTGGTWFAIRVECEPGELAGVGALIRS